MFKANSLPMRNGQPNISNKVRRQLFEVNLSLHQKTPDRIQTSQCETTPRGTWAPESTSRKKEAKHSHSNNYHQIHYHNQQTCKCNKKLERSSQQDCRLLTCLLQPKKKAKPDMNGRKILINLDQMKLGNKPAEMNLKIHPNPNDIKAEATSTRTPCSEQTSFREGKQSPYQGKHQQKLPKNDQAKGTRTPISSKDIKESIIRLFGEESSIREVVSKDKKLQSPTPTSRYTDGVDRVEDALSALYKKLTSNNLPYESWLNYLNFNYKALSIAELQFIADLFERVEPNYLSSMDYTTFKYKAIQKCPAQLQSLVDSYPSACTNPFI